MSIEQQSFPGRVLACPRAKIQTICEVSECEVIEKKIPNFNENTAYVKFDRLEEAVKWASLVPESRFSCYRELAKLLSSEEEVFLEEMMNPRLYNFGVVMISYKDRCAEVTDFDFHSFGIIHQSPMFLSKDKELLKQIVEFENIDDAIYFISKKPHLSTQLYIPSDEERIGLFSTGNFVDAQLISCVAHNHFYEISLLRVEMGLDPRTTCMIRNIPNKYTQTMLIDRLNEAHAGAYDFLYLRMDFRNRCNVGYAFINFIEYRSIPSFVHRIQGKKWDKFNSDKICAITYARIQGKSALIAKFRKSRLIYTL